MKEDAPLRARPPPAIMDEICKRVKNCGRKGGGMGLGGHDWKIGCERVQSYMRIYGHPNK